MLTFIFFFSTLLIYFHGISKKWDSGPGKNSKNPHTSGVPPFLHKNIKILTTLVLLLTLVVLNFGFSEVLAPIL